MKTEGLKLAIAFLLFFGSAFFIISGCRAAPTISVSPTTVLTDRGTITISWSGISSPSVRDWIGIFQENETDTDSMGNEWDWFYAGSCTQTPGSAKSSGSCSYSVTNLYDVEYYKVRLFSDDGFEELASSNVFQINAATVNVTPSSVIKGNVITVSWSDILQPKGKDWIGIYKKNEWNPNNDKGWFYAGSCTQTSGAAKASGSCAYTIQESYKAGEYRIDLFANDTNDVLTYGPSFVVTVAPSCQNDCSPLGLTQCNGSGFQTCGNYDSDSCLEWSTDTPCGVSQN